VFADVGKTLLAVEEGIDKGVESQSHFVLSACVR
jgi:hypothetical protein